MGNAALALLLHLALASSSASAGAATVTAAAAAAKGTLLHRWLAFALLERSAEDRGASVRGPQRVARGPGRVWDGGEHLMLGIRVVRATVLRRPVVVGLKGAAEICAGTGWGAEGHRRTGGA